MNNEEILIGYWREASWQIASWQTKRRDVSTKIFIPGSSEPHFAVFVSRKEVESLYTIYNITTKH